MPLRRHRASARRVRACSITFIALLVGTAGQAAAQRQRGADLTISLVTVGPGTDFFGWAGHSALLVSSSRSSQPFLFDYGVIPSNAATTRGALRGRVTAYAAAWDPRVQIPAWILAGRTVRIQALALTPAQRIDIFDRLTADEQSGRRAYRYDYLTNNCATRIRDLLDSVLGGALRRGGSAMTGMTIRTIAERHSRASWAIALFDIALNDEIDQPITLWEGALFPDRLAALVAGTTIVDSEGVRRPFASESIAPPQGAPAVDTWYGTGWRRQLLAGAMLGATMVGLGFGVMSGRRRAQIALGVGIALSGAIIGLLGITIGAAWLFTGFTFAPHNENLLLFNPLMLASFPLGLAYASGVPNAARWLRRLTTGSLTLATLAIALKAIPAFDQDNWRMLFVIIPLLAGTAGALRIAGIVSAQQHSTEPQMLDKPPARTSTRPTFWRALKPLAVALLAITSMADVCPKTTDPNVAGFAFNVTSDLPIALAPGGTATVDFIVSRFNGFTGPITIAPTGGSQNGVSMPAVTIAAGATTGTGTLTGTLAATLGSHDFNVTAQGSTGTLLLKFAIGVATPGSYAISLSRDAKSYYVAGEVAHIAVALTRNNFTQPVVLSVANLPVGATASITQPGTGNTGEVDLTIGSSTVPAFYVPHVIGTASPAAPQDATIGLTVNLPQFQIFATPTAVSINQNSAATVVIASTRDLGNVAPIAVTGASLNPGITATPVNVNLGSTANFVIAVAQNVSAGIYAIQVHGNQPGRDDSQVQVDITVLTVGSYTLAAVTAPLNVSIGSPQPDVVNINRTNFTGGVTLTGSSDAGITIATDPLPITTAQTNITVNATSAATLGTHTVTLTGVFPGRPNVTATFAVIVAATNTNAIAKVVVTPNTASMAAGTVATPFTTQLLDAAGVPTSGTSTMTVDISSIASAGAGGQITAFAPGVTGVTAIPSTGSAFGRGLLRVAGASGIARLSISPLHTFIPITGPNVTFFASASDVNGATITPSTTTWPAVWASSNTAAATVNSSTGEVAPIANGGAIITATRDGQRAQTAVTIGSRGAIQGSVTSATNQYLSGLTVAVNGVQLSVATNPGTNQFALPNVIAGNYSIVITVDGYPSSAAVLVTVVNGVITTMSPVAFP